MIVTKGHKSYAIFYIFIYMVLSLVLLHTLYIAGNQILLKYCSYILIFLFGVRVFAIAMIECVTVTMNSDGCTLRLFLWEKFHPWSSIYTPKYVYYPLYSSYWFTNRESECVLFSIKHTEMKKIKPDMSTFITKYYPFSLDVFYVEFHPRTKAIAQSNPPIPKNPYQITPKEAECSFPVDREVFKRCMREWGVKIDGLDLDADGKTVQKKEPVGIFARAADQSSKDEKIQKKE